MKVSIISCWYQTSYGDYTNALRAALERLLKQGVDVIASNCGCGDPAETSGVLQDPRCAFVRFPHVSYWKSQNPIKYGLRNAARQVVYHERARRYRSAAEGADVVHFQQTLNAYGSVAAFNWLRMPTRAARVITVHECDPYQLDRPETNLAYNSADRVIVHSREMKRTLIDLGVDENLVDVVEHGVSLPAPSEGPRADVLFYGGHKIHSGKGFDTLLEALRSLSERLGAAAPKVLVHGHWGTRTPPAGSEMVERFGMGDRVVWLNQLSLEEEHRAYAGALLLVVPFTGSFAGLPATLALANGVPVIATRRAGLPDHLGDAAVWVNENDPSGIADAMADLLSSEEKRQALAAAGRARAERELTWDRVAAKTRASYERALEHRRGAADLAHAVPAGG